MVGRSPFPDHFVFGFSALLFWKCQAANRLGICRDRELFARLTLFFTRVPLFVRGPLAAVVFEELTPRDNLIARVNRMARGTL